MPKIVLTDVVKRWKDFYATDHVSLEIPDRAFITLLGPSGCGKTTILRMIAGLETPTTGQISIGDQVVFDSEAGINIPANKRKVGFLFQNYALWPNMTVYQNITFGLKNVKEELPTYDYVYKTRKDILRILQSPKKVISLVNDSRDKKGRIIDDRAIIKIIDEFVVSSYTAKEIFKLHLEEGGVEEKVSSTVANAKAAIKAEENKWLQKNVLIEEDGKLVSVPDYANKKNTLNEKEFATYLKHCYDLEKVYTETMKNTDEIHKSLNLRFDDSKAEKYLTNIKKVSKGLPCEETINTELDALTKNLPLIREEKEELKKILNETRIALGTLGLGEDYQKLIVNYLRKYALAIAQGEEKTMKVILRDLATEVEGIKKQVSNQVSTFIDKLPKNISGATVDVELENTMKDLDYLPENQVLAIRNELLDLMKTSIVFDKRENKEALKRFKEGLTALDPEDRPIIESYVPEIEKAVLSGTINDIYLSVKKDLSNYNADVIRGILEEIQAIAVTYVNNSERQVKVAISHIEKISMYLVEKTKEVLLPVFDQLNEPARKYGDTVSAMVNSIKEIENSVTSLSDRAHHLASERSLDKEEIELSLRRVARIVKIEEFMDRYPNELSGGQQQRVAIARTLAPGPKVLFMDEPLSNLDAKLRLEMRSELKRLHLETGATFVYVTHDQLEAMTLATHICLLNNGVLQQYDAPLTIYNSPANLFVADFVGNPSISLIEVKAKQQQDGTIELNFFNNRTAIFTPNKKIDLKKLIVKRDETIAKKEELLSILKKQKSYVEKGNKDTVFNYHIPTIHGTIDRKDEKRPENDEYVIAVRPEYFSLTAQGAGLPGEVYSAMPSGMETTLKTNVDGYILTSVNFGASDFQIGEKIEINITGDNILLFDKVTGDLITSGMLKIC